MLHLKSHQELLCGLSVHLEVMVGVLIGKVLLEHRYSGIDDLACTAYTVKKERKKKEVIVLTLKS